MAGSSPREIADRVRSRGLSWLRVLRLKVLAYAIIIPLAAWGVIALSPAWAAIPIVGVAVAAITMTVGKITKRLAHATCWTCGADLSDAPESAVGMICDNCGAVNQHRPVTAEIAPEEVQAWASLAENGDENDANRTMRS